MIKVAVIGVGVMGKNHARVFSELNSCRLVALADSDPNVKELADKYKCSFYDDYSKMLDNEEIDAVSICVPTSLHKKVAIDCINKGKHVLLEKPIASTIDEANDIINIAKKNKVSLLIGHIERFNPAVIELKSLIDKGILGDIISINARRVGVYPPRVKDANILVDLAIHDIDIFNYLLGKKPKKVICNAGKALIDRKDHAEILLSYNGTTGYIQTNWITPIKIRDLAVTGTKGYAELNYITQDLYLYETNVEKEFNDFGDFTLKFGKATKKKVDVKHQEPLMLEIKHFLGCVTGKAKPLVTGENSRDALSVVLGR